jgi:ATP-binding cassette, subfamily F, member 2
MEAAGLVEKVEQPKLLRFNFDDVRKMPPPIIAFNEVAFSYSGRMEDALYKNLDFGIECVGPCDPLCYSADDFFGSMDSRIAIVGQNGTGKSTLINLITGVLQPIKGSVQRHAGLKLGERAPPSILGRFNWFVP